MEDDDRDDLLQCTDDESMSETEEQCLPIDPKPEYSTNQCGEKLTTQAKIQFLSLALLVILSSTSLIILLPLYLETVNVKGDAYTMLHFTTSFTLLALLIATICAKKFCKRMSCVKITKPPIGWSKALKIGFVYAVSGFLVIYAVDRKRVMCHLQDPIKGIVLVFSLIYYFFFCRKMMGLQRIFSSTTIIVGLFISVDYGLCDEFRCRGAERERKSDDAGNWPWQIHSAWAAIYILGLALYSAHFTMLERYLVPSQLGMMYTSISASFLSTVSRLVSSRDSSVSLNGQVSSTQPLVQSQNTSKPHSPLHLALWVHIVAWAFTTIFMFTDFIPSVGKGSNAREFLNFTVNGYRCHFTMPLFSQTAYSECGNVSLYAWMFLICYIIYVLSSTHFLIMTQSAVFTMATMTTALPLTGIWWSLFYMSNLDHGLLVWAPSVTGELICSLLGLPIILLGVILLCKSHFNEINALSMHRENVQHLA